MKIRSDVNRRSFFIAPAGYFNVMRPNSRFIASHLQRRFPYLVRQSMVADRGHAVGLEAAKPLQSIQPGTQNGSALRWMLIVLAAIGITLGFFQYLRL